jgi:hypothetical protein
VKNRLRIVIPLETFGRSPSQPSQRKEDAHDRSENAANRTDHQPQPRNVQPQIRRPNGANPPRPQPVHQQRRIRNRAYQPQQTPNPGQQRASTKNNRRIPLSENPSACNVPDLTRALLDAEFEKERSQHQRRHDEKETEIQKVFTEIRRATRSRLPLFAHGNDLEIPSMPGLTLCEESQP